MKRDSPMDGLRKKAAEELRAWAATLEVKKEGAERAKLAERRRRRRIRLGMLLGGLAVVWGSAAAYLFWPLRSDPLPVDAFGVWQTADPRYADRSFELTATTLTFRAGGMDMQYLVRRVIRSPRDRNRYTIEYEDTGSVIALVVLFEPGRRTLRFANQPEVIWTPAPP